MQALGVGDLDGEGECAFGAQSGVLGPCVSWRVRGAGPALSGGPRAERGGTAELPGQAPGVARAAAPIYAPSFESTRLDLPPGGLARKGCDSSSPGCPHGAPPALAVPSPDPEDSPWARRDKLRPVVT
ncbi:unnamed protein product [Natator depressus]